MKTEAAAWHSKKVVDCQFARLVPCKPGSLTKALARQVQERGHAERRQAARQTQPRHPVFARSSGRPANAATRT
eukprot:6469684-Prymnesium_polylepis.1